MKTIVKWPDQYFFILNKTPVCIPVRSWPCSNRERTKKACPPLPVTD